MIEIRIRKTGITLLSLPFLVMGLFSETYTVKRGDTLYSIATSYDVSVGELMSLNGIENPSSMAIGLVLTIPGGEEDTPLASPEPLYHRVDPGDTYYNISRRYNLDVDTLLRLNDLKVDDILSIGQTLVVGEKKSDSPVSRKPAPISTDRSPVAETPRGPAKEDYGPSLVINGSGRIASTPIWPVTGQLYRVDGDFQGVLIESVPSSYVEAVTEGEVVWAGPYWMFGNVVLVDSQEFIYFYGGNSDIFVNVGQKITAGTRLGRLDNKDGKGKLYFSAFKEGKVVDLAKLND